ncbi:MAG: DUF4416 family protein [Thermodesulfovibrionales bacterium]
MPCVSRRPEDALLFTGVLFSSPELFDQACIVMQQTFGNILLQSPVFQWEHSSYYADELGSPLFRSFLFFQNMVDTAAFAAYKHEACSIESAFEVQGKRRLNIDPGYMTSAKVVLASRKNYSHRICIGKGIYAELELYFQDGRFNPLPYTYTDYREARSCEVFQQARLLLKKMAPIGGEKDQKATAEQ